MFTHSREAGAVAFFSGVATVAVEGVSASKLFGAFLIAICTGAGYKLGTLAIDWVKSEIAKRKAKDK